jgi:hypothetical protein
MHLCTLVSSNRSAHLARWPNSLAIRQDKIKCAQLEHFYEYESPQGRQRFACVVITCEAFSAWNSDKLSKVSQNYAECAYIYLRLSENFSVAHPSHL